MLNLGFGSHSIEHAASAWDIEQRSSKVQISAVDVMRGDTRGNAIDVSRRPGLDAWLSNHRCHRAC
jgi:hypothetical protein